MATEVELPALGESVTEGTITAWLVDVGDEVQADQPLFELSSDKVDTEVPAPIGGVLKEIKVDVDETVEVGTVVAVIGDADEPAEGGGQTAEAEEETAEAETAEAEEAPAGEGDGEGRLMSPVVRRMVREHNVDLSQISASGQGGRITREDVEAVIGGEEAQVEAPQEAAEAQAPQEAAEAPPAEAEEPAPARQPSDTGDRRRVEDLSRIRKQIASKMMESMHNTAQLTTVQEVDVTRVMSARAAHKDDFKSREGVSLSPFVFFCRAAILAIRNHEKINAKPDWEAGKVTYYDYVNLGIAVDTPRGLLVPNVKAADDLSLPGLARAIKDAADKARGAGGKKLEMQDIQGGTFTVTNIGSLNVLIDTPILNYPEVAILGTGAVVKRPVVVEDEAGSTIAIRAMSNLCLTYDHTLIDGADAARYVSEVRHIVETHDWEGELGGG
ncbi:MAG: 2-oxo acid dehydrogenase subunit E2 [Actinomycetota bacterium]|nr:2-oxo acid dehydrogenase subunit E2 [Actinomycetota bacterium]